MRYRLKVVQALALRVYAWLRSHLSREIEFVETAHVPVPPRAVRDATDDRSKQRKRKKMAGAFLAALDGVADSITDMGVKPKDFDKEFGWVRAECCPALLSLIEKHTDIGYRGIHKPADLVAHLANLDETFVGADSDDQATSWFLHRIARAYPRELRSQFPMLIPGAQFYTHTISHAGWKNLCTKWLFATRDQGGHWSVMWVGRDRTHIEPLTSNADNEERPWCSLKWLEGALYHHHLDDVAWCLRMERGPVKLIWRCTDSIAREMLMLRDSGGRRRDAALHWVTDHDRIVKGEVRRVRAHLRGKKEFTWGRWACSLEEAAFDRDALDTSERLPTSQIEPRQAIRKAL